VEGTLPDGRETVRRMGTPHGGDAARRSEEHTRETRKERVDRELLELLNELRVALPGVQILFAFLLIVPFQQTASRTTDFQRDVYFVTLLAVCVATGLLIAPAAQHRVLFRMHDKEGLLHRSSRMAYAGLVVLALAITTAVLLVTDVLFSRTQAWISAAAVAAVLVWWWIAVPFWQRSHSRQEDPRDDDED
jgi:Family of unknown function (DUF6328)